MTRRAWSLAGFVVGLLGAGAVAVGTWLPWVTVRPGYDGPVPAVYLPGMDAGFASLDWFLLLGAVVALVGVAPVSIPRLGRARAAGVAILAGGLVVVLALVSLFSSVGSFLGTFVPDVGFYLAALGGVHLSVGGMLQLHALRRE
jgi:hypothetical protein